LSFSIIYFSRFLDVSAANMHSLLTLLVSPPKGGGEVPFGDIPGSPLPRELEALWGQGLAGKLLLDDRGQEKICFC
jgi:hypothetical protein